MDTLKPVDPDQIVLISINDISPSPYQSRTVFDESELDELASSIKEKGVLQPITIRPVEGKPTPYELVMGERRWRASKKAGNETIRSIVRQMTDQDALEINIIENCQRVDLGPMEEARSIQSLVEVNGGNKAEAARKIGKLEPYVYNKLALLALPREVQNMLDANLINEAAARVILDIEGEDKQIEAAKLAQKLNLSAVQLRGRMQKHINKKDTAGGGKKESSGDRKPTTFKNLSGSLVNVYESLEGFDFGDLGGDEAGLKNREMLRRQVALVRQSLAHAETALLRDPPPERVKGEGNNKPPKLSSTAA